jgi:hypothetical protein
VVAKEISSRVADVRFVLDQLAVINRGGNPDHEHKPMPAGIRGALDLSRVGMYGRSDGGSTTAAAMHADDKACRSTYPSAGSGEAGPVSGLLIPEGISRHDRRRHDRNSLTIILRTYASGRSSWPIARHRPLAQISTSCARSLARSGSPVSAVAKRSTAGS